jgi:hypothetical protein
VDLRERRARGTAGGADVLAQLLLDRRVGEPTPQVARIDAGVAGSGVDRRALVEQLAGHAAHAQGAQQAPLEPRRVQAGGDDGPACRRGAVHARAEAAVDRHAVALL